ncbi:MAG TPA: ABC transporter permease [Anaerolineales bacterium]
MVITRLWRTFLTGARASLVMESVDFSLPRLFGTKLPRFILQPLFFVILAYVAGGPELARFALIGNAMGNAAIHSLVNLGASIEIEKWAGTFPLLMAVPANWLPLMIGRAAAGYLESLISVFVTFAVLTPFMAGADLPFDRLLLAMPVMMLTTASLAGMGWLLGSLTLPTRVGLLASNMVAYAMFVVCGLNFPLDAMPPFLQAIGRALPLTHGLMAIREVIDGASYLQVAPLVGLEIAIGLVYAAVAWLVFRKRLNDTRRTGNMELV